MTNATSVICDWSIIEENQMFIPRSGSIDVWIVMSKEYVALSWPNFIQTQIQFVQSTFKFSSSSSASAIFW